jgi:hypothetical protein
MRITFAEMPKGLQVILSMPVEARYEDSVTLALDLKKCLEWALRPDIQHV